MKASAVSAFATVSLAALVAANLATPAYAQDETPQAAEESRGLEIVVTAQKR